jgi:hypothetical protein
MHRKQLLALAGIAGLGGLVLSAPASNAATVVNFGYATGGAVTAAGTLNQSPALAASGAINAGTWNFSASGSAGSGTQDSNSLQVTSATSGVFDVFVTFSGIMGPLGSALNFVSSFTLNSVVGTASVTESTYLDSGNSSLPTSAASVPGVLLDSTTLSTLTTNLLSNTGNTGGGPYSITEEYAINATGATTTNATIGLTATTPLPGALALFGGGLGVLGLLARRKKRKGVTALSAIA